MHIHIVYPRRKLKTWYFQINNDKKQKREYSLTTLQMKKLLLHSAHTWCTYNTYGVVNFLFFRFSIFLTSLYLIFGFRGELDFLCGLFCYTCIHVCTEQYNAKYEIHKKKHRISLAYRLNTSSIWNVCYWYSFCCRRRRFFSSFDELCVTKRKLKCFTCVCVCLS